MAVREQLIALLESAESAVYWNSEDKDFIQKITDHLLANGVTFQKWIPVSERLPEKDVKVLTFGVYGFSVNYRDRFSGKWRGVNGKPQWITHWMPLPEPPGGEVHG